MLQKERKVLTIFAALGAGLVYFFHQGSNNLKSCLLHERRNCKSGIPLAFGSVVRAGSAYGNWGYLPNLLTSDSIVYSVGLGGDLTWDLEIINRHSCKIFGFDNTPAHMQYWKSLDITKMLHLPEGTKWRSFMRNFVHSEQLLLW